MCKNEQELEQTHMEIILLMPFKSFYMLCQKVLYMCVVLVFKTQFANNVVDVSTLHLGIHQPLLEECLMQYTSISEIEWLCLSCK